MLTCVSEREKKQRRKEGQEKRGTGEKRDRRKEGKEKRGKGEKRDRRKNIG